MHKIILASKSRCMSYIES